MPTQLTLRGVDKALDRRLKQEAKRRGRSVNKTALELLRQATGLTMPDSTFGVRQPDADGLYHDLDHLFGGWTKEEADEFDEVLAEQRKIDPEMWANLAVDEDEAHTSSDAAARTPRRRVPAARKSA